MAIRTLRPRADDVYERLRSSIVRGEIRPNQRLVEVELAEQLEASRTPVREALQRLAAEGLVSSRRRGWIAREHSAEEIRQIYEIRMALEGFACRLTAERASPEVIDHIAAIQRPEIMQPPYNDLVTINDRFHDAIITASGNPSLIELIQRSRQYYFNYRIATLYTRDEADAALAGHERIVQALRDRDGARAEAMTREHIREGLVVLLGKVRL